MRRQTNEVKIIVTTDDLSRCAGGHAAALDNIAQRPYGCITSGSSGRPLEFSDPRMRISIIIWLCPWPVFSPRFWPPEVPTPRGEFSDSASLSFPPLARFFHPERLALGDDEHVVMEQSIQQADGRRVIGPEASPVLEGPVRGDTEGSTLVGGGDEAEEELGAGVIHRGEADLVDQDEVGLQDPLEDTADRVVGQAPIEGLDEFDALK